MCPRATAGDAIRLQALRGKSLDEADQRSQAGIGGSASLRVVDHGLVPSHVRLHTYVCEAFGVDDPLRQSDRFRLIGDPCISAPGLEVDHHLETASGLPGRCAELGNIAEVVGDDCQVIGPCVERREALQLRFGHDRGKERHARYPARDHDLGFSERRATLA